MGCKDQPLSQVRMTEKVSPNEFVRLLTGLEHQQEAQRVTVEGASLEPQLAMLQEWQSSRLAKTYADLLADQQYQAACQFFLSDVYAARDFSQRNQDAEHLYNILSRFLPDSMLALLADTIRINQLTSQLDHALLKVLVNELGVTDTITPEVYAQAYRQCNNYNQRREQIELLTRILWEAANGARSPVFAISLRLARGPAQRAGWGELYGFLERGYWACKPMRKVETFVKTIEQREMRLLDQIFRGDRQPF